MALPSSGEISFENIAAHLRMPLPRNITCNFQNTQWRGLAQRPTPGSLIGIGNFHGKWAGTRMNCGTSGSLWGFNRGVFGTEEGGFHGQELSLLVADTGGSITVVTATPPNAGSSTRMRVTDDNMSVVADFLWMNHWDGARLINSRNGIGNIFPNGTIRWFSWPS